MDHPLRRPEEILAYRSLRQILAAKPKALWTVGPKDSTLSAMHLMAEKNIGLVVVVENRAIVGVLSERDCVRRLVLAGKSPVYRGYLDPRPVERGGGAPRKGHW